LGARRRISSGVWLCIHCSVRVIARASRCAVSRCASIHSRGAYRHRRRIRGGADRVLDAFAVGNRRARAPTGCAS
jgi:hypothetical protein